MKKLLMSLSFLAVCTAASAEVTVVNPSNKSSPATVFAMAFKNAIGADTKFYQSQTCEDAQKVFDTTKDAVMIYNSSIEFAARNKGLNCRLKGVTAEQTVFIGKQYMSVCTAKDSGKTFKDDKVVMGMASMYSTKPHEADFRSNGVNMTLVPFAGSKDILNGVLNKDLTFGFIGTSMASKSPGLNCVYSTDPSADNFIGKSLNLKVPDFRITLVVYTNSKDPAVLSTLKNVEKNDEFSKYISSSKTQPNWAVKSKDVEDVVEFVDNMEKNWVSK